MARENTPCCSICRRDLLAGTGAAATGALAGCLGGSGGDEIPDDADEDFPEWDPEDPAFPQRMSTLMDHDTGRIEDIQAFEERDEPVYGDPVQETPDDEDELIDPDTLTFAMTPTEDPAAYEGMFDPLIENIEAETGRDVENNLVQNYAAQVEAMRSERLHIAGFSTGPLPFAVNLAGAVPFAIQVSEDDAGYYLWAITHMSNTEIDSVEDFAGKDGAHGAPSSNSGNLMPRAIFEDRFDVEPGEDYSVEHVGSHENLVLTIYHQDHEVAPVCSYCVTRVAERGDVDADAIKVVWQSDPIVTTGFSYRYNLPPDVQEGIERAFLEYDYSGTELAQEFGGRGLFTEIDYATHWHDVLLTHRANGVDLTDLGDI
ncbi:phosphate/phosphite/phosphonate ABC transporter substrate-binding protein [Halopiger djelfimassiliensis]|uniref:phosphate/phosphite/phosphonate ABC transporter substrate-binding protein n=1 Tax=Halopiger djelfimassiliensis TaxID=1293047 RepID=UPI000677D598|nr:phosphate/phosphite/phosphonate ABC transporter substrate-binding protein [Halopiger djelfimassiliensis]